MQQSYTDEFCRFSEQQHSLHADSKNEKMYTRKLYNSYIVILRRAAAADYMAEMSGNGSSARILQPGGDYREQRSSWAFRYNTDRM